MIKMSKSSNFLIIATLCVLLDFNNNCGLVEYKQQKNYTTVILILNALKHKTYDISSYD